jgi:hypothetical protein
MHVQVWNFLSIAIVDPDGFIALIASTIGKTLCR